MSKPFDAILNELIDGNAADWGRMLCAKIGIPLTTIELLDTDLATTLQADKLFRLGGPNPGLIHLELEGNSRLGIPLELARYHILTKKLYNLPIDTFLVLLRPKAWATDMTGVLEGHGLTGVHNLAFDYHVIKLWEEPMAPLLNGGLGTLPLAMLTNEAGQNLDAAFAQFSQRLQSQPVSDRVKQLMHGANYTLLGLRYPEDQIIKLYEEVAMILEDSTTYQGLIRRGARETLIRVASNRFGPPSAEVLAVLTAITDRARIDRMVDQVHSVNSWPELLIIA